jgi:hypothetical protein
MSETLSLPRPETHPASPRRAAAVEEVRELFITRAFPIYVPSGTDIGGGKVMSTTICTDEYGNV